MAMTVPYVSQFLSPSDTNTTSHCVLAITVTVMCALPSQSLLGTSSQPARIPVQGATLTVSILTLLEGRKGRACGVVFMKSAVVSGKVPGLHMRSPLSH